MDSLKPRQTLKKEKSKQEIALLESCMLTQEQFFGRAVYPSYFKAWEFAKASARALIPSKQPLIQEIGAMQKELKGKMLAQGKTKF